MKIKVVISEIETPAFPFNLQQFFFKLNKRIIEKFYIIKERMVSSVSVLKDKQIMWVCIVPLKKIFL